LADVPERISAGAFGHRKHIGDRIRPDMLWCDKSDSASYKRLVRAPFSPSHEEMRSSDGLYDICLVMDWNISSRARNRG
ncbi:hypothetical protein AB9F41_38040, partial [Rhizobium leguminosarum]